MRRLRTEMLRYAAVGVGATLLHVASALLLNGLLHMSPLWANFCAFLLGWSFSYRGNYVWTFRGSSAHRIALPRYLGLSIGLFAVNQAMVYLAVEVWGRPFWVALIAVVMIVPVAGFVASRFWAFPSRRVEV